MQKRTIKVLLLTGLALIPVGFGTFIAGEFWARRTNDLDGWASMLGFFLFVALSGSGVFLTFVAIASALLRLGRGAQS